MSSFRKKKTDTSIVGPRPNWLRALNSEPIRRLGPVSTANATYR